MASTGHAETQAPQSMQTSGSMKSCVSSSLPWMQSTGHTSTHDLSLVPMQGSVMIYAIAHGGLPGEGDGSYRQKAQPSRRTGEHPTQGPVPRSVRRPTARERAQDEQQDHRSDEGDEDAPQVDPADARVAERIEQPTADEGADDADDQVAEDTPRALAGDDPLREKPRDEPHD